MGARDVRLQSNGKQDYRLRELYAGFSKADPEPTRVPPVPVQVLIHLMAQQTQSDFHQAVQDLTCIAFFYLCRPGEYTPPSPSSSYSAPFRLIDVTFTSGNTSQLATTATVSFMQHASSVTLTYTNQKNGVRNEKILHGRTPHPHLCPVKRLFRRVQHLRQHQAEPNTPLYTVFTTTGLTQVSSHNITTALRTSAAATSHLTNILPSLITARGLRAGGAMALLCARVDKDEIKLVGRWKSDAMLRYLHSQAMPLMKHFSTLMTQHGSFSFPPDSIVPVQATMLLSP